MMSVRQRSDSLFQETKTQWPVAGGKPVEEGVQPAERALNVLIFQLSGVQIPCVPLIFNIANRLICKR